MQTRLLTCIATSVLLLPPLAAEIRINITVDRGSDDGRAFGSIVEMSDPQEKVVVGVGFPNTYNTHYRADRHAVEVFIRPKTHQRTWTVEELPRPNETMCGAYLHSAGGQIYSTFGGLRRWDKAAHRWIQADPTKYGTETMRVADRLLVFGDSAVTYAGNQILAPPEVGKYKEFFYTNGYLCFYHIDREGSRRSGSAYRPYVDDADGFSRLVACPWTPGEPSVDLSRAIIHTLPVVGETTFAWGVLGDTIVTGSNIGGFYIFPCKDITSGSNLIARKWNMTLPPDLQKSFQLYSSLIYHDRLLLGQYPTGHVFEFDGVELRQRAGWPPVLEGVATYSREAQTTVLYGGQLLVGVWPWAELWSYHPDVKQWSFMQRMFDHPKLSDTVTHPYDRENKDNTPRNRWGQRVTALVPSGADLFVSTSAKAPYRWEPEKYPFLLPDLWRSYGKVYRLRMAGHLSADTKWTDGPTKLSITINRQKIRVHQDEELIGESPLDSLLGNLIETIRFTEKPQWGKGIYGPFTGDFVSGTVSQTQP